MGMDDKEEYLIDGIPPEEWFEKQARQNRPREKLTSEGYKERLLGAMGRYQDRTKGKDPRIEDYLSKLPDNVRDIARVFCESFQRPPIKNERSYWMKAFKEQYEMGLTPDIISAAIAKMDNEGLTIKSPQSVTAIAWDLARKGSKPTRNKNVIVVGGTEDEKRSND